MTTAVFASGGGFTGAYQAGAILRLDEAGVKPEYGYGISVGALNVAKWMMGEAAELSLVWRRIRFSDIFRGPAWWNLARSDGMYSNAPLWDLIKREIDPAKIRGEYMCGAVNLAMSRYKVFTNSEVHGKDLLHGILASTAMPVLHTSVSVGGEKHVDGGVWNISPIGDVLRLAGRELDHIYVINCQMDDEPDRTKPKSLRGVVDVGRESIGMLMQRNVQADVRAFQRINYILEEVGRPVGKYRYIPYTLIQPSRPLGSGMNADRQHLDELFSMGYRDADSQIGAAAA